MKLDRHFWPSAAPPRLELLRQGVVASGAAVSIGPRVVGFSIFFGRSPSCGRRLRRSPSSASASSGGMAADSVPLDVIDKRLKDFRIFRHGDRPKTLMPQSHEEHVHVMV